MKGHTQGNRDCKKHSNLASGSRGSCDGCVISTDRLWASGPAASHLQNEVVNQMIPKVPSGPRGLGFCDPPATQ